MHCVGRSILLILITMQYFQQFSGVETTYSKQFTIFSGYIQQYAVFSGSRYCLNSSLSIFVGRYCSYFRWAVFGGVDTAYTNHYGVFSGVDTAYTIHYAEFLGYI